MIMGCEYFEWKFLYTLWLVLQHSKECIAEI